MTQLTARPTTYRDYYDLYNSICSNGTRHDGTRALYNVEYHVPAYRDDEGNEYIVLPSTRGHKPVVVEYAIYESMWYAFGSNYAAEISQLYPFWSRMADKDGYVNSNYGYQIREGVRETGFRSANEAAEMLASQIKNGQATASTHANLLNIGNQSSTHDVPCNVRVQFKLVTDKQGCLHLSGRSIARSIDMTFGLPYDQYMLQLITHLVARRLRDELLTNHEIIIDGCSFNILNCHIYDHDYDAFMASLHDGIKDWCKCTMVPAADAMSNVIAGQTYYKSLRKTLSMVARTDDSDEIKGIRRSVRRDLTQRVDSINKSPTPIKKVMSSYYLAHEFESLQENSQADITMCVAPSKQQVEVNVPSPRVLDLSPTTERKRSTIEDDESILMLMSDMSRDVTHIWHVR